MEKQGRLRCSTFVLLLQHMKAFIHQKLMLRTYCCLRELGRSYSRSIVGIVNCKTYIRNSRRNRPAIMQLMIGLNIDRSVFYKELKLVKPTFLFEFKIKQRSRTLFFDVVDRALNIQFASLKPLILYFVKPSVFFA